MSDAPQRLDLKPIDRPSVADQAFDTLHSQIVSLSLAPGARLSETEVARALATSRQPVRDAFYRLSKLGFLNIQPQRATIVSLISTQKVMEAMFVRTALEVETVKGACQKITINDAHRLRDILGQQARAIREDDRARFHSLDDVFHQEICTISGHPFAWQTIRETKSHLDRVRVLSLSFNMERTLTEHREITDAFEKRDSLLSERFMRQHLSRLVDELPRIRAENPDFFSN